MKTKIYKAIKTVPFSSSVKVFYVEVKNAAANNVKKIKKDSIRESIYKGFYDLTKSIKEGDYFIVEG